MSHTYELLCTDCRVSLWIAQGWVRSGDCLEKIRESGRLYSMPEHLIALRDFLFSHMGHTLGFVDTEDVPYDILDKELDEDDDDDEWQQPTPGAPPFHTIYLSTITDQMRRWVDTKRHEAAQRGSFWFW